MQRSGIQPVINLKAIILSQITVFTIAFGWKYPVLGFIVPIVMLTGVFVGTVRGRYTCGNLCPRGAFYNIYLYKIARNKKYPKFLKANVFRWIIFIVLMSFFVFRIVQNPTSQIHLGLTFWSMCAVTTVIGVIIGIIYKPRAWCTFCPMGTLQQLLGGHRNRLKIYSPCLQCGKCEKACPMDLPILKYRSEGVSKERDCIKCRACTKVCPKKVLEVPSMRKIAPSPSISSPAP